MSDAASLNADAGPPGQAGTSSNIDEHPTKLTFQDSPTDLAPRQEVKLTVQATPPAKYTVRFALPQAEQVDPLDAVLDQSEVTTDDSGLASVKLIAPSTSAEFSVRASISGGLSIERSFKVTDAGFVTVVVQPIYPSHVRFITTWTASARPGETCAMQPSIPAPDGTIKSLADRMVAPKLTGVPAAVPVAITLRSGFFVGGCTSVEMFPPGPADREHMVEVTVLNRPIELAQSSVNLALGLDPEDTAFRDLSLATTETVLLALRGSSTDDADALLDAMRNALSGEARQQLDSARKAEGWDALVRAHWVTPTRLHDSVSGWLARGSAALDSLDQLLTGQLRAVDEQSAELTLATVAGLEPEQVGFVKSALVSWSADADDTIVLGTDLYLSSSSLTTGLGVVAALEDFPEAATAEQALALSLDCSALGGVLAAAGSDYELAYPMCNAACLSALCEQATASLWQRARDATSTKPVRLALTAAGLASVGDAAEVAGIAGSWVGELSSTAKPTGGSLTATAQMP